jgi:predicted peptidase
MLIGAVVLLAGLSVGVGVLIGQAIDEDKRDRQVGQHAYRDEIVLRYNRDYLLYLPTGYDEPGQRLPLVLFLHGAGERGAKIDLVGKHGPPKHVAAGEEYPFILVSPQCPAGKYWRPEVLRALLERLMTELPVDRSRVYCTGLSMGGFGTWAMASEYPKLFAAIAPVCGGGDPKQAKRLASIPTWVFHGEKDSVVPLARSRDMVEAVRKAGGEPKFTVYPGVGHNSWAKAYADPALWVWMLAQTNPAARTRPGGSGADGQ